MKNLKLLLFLAVCPLIVWGQYTEDFSFPNKGYLENYVNDFAGVDWTMTPWPNSGTTVQLGRDIANYFKTTSDGVLEAIDTDVEVCWVSPELTISGGAASFELDLTWTGYDVAADYLDVKYSTNGGSSWTTLPNEVGFPSNVHTVQYNSGTVGAGSLTNFGASGITGTTLIIRVCVDNSSLTEVTTLDNVSATNADVPGSGPVCDLVLNSISSTDENCPGANDGTLTVTATTTNGPLTYSISGPVSQSNATGFFMDLPDGNYTVTVDDNSFVLGACQDSGAGVIGAGVDTTTPTASNPATTTVECDGDIPAVDPAVVIDEDDDCVVPCTTEPWINEFHYDNSGTDAGEFIEIAGPAGLNLSAYTIYTYDGFNGQVDQTFTLSGTIDNEQNGFGALTFNTSGLQNQLEGMALVKNGTIVIEFLSYEGTILAQNGPAQGLTSVDVGVLESNSQANNESLSRIGTGNTGAEFTFADQVATAGALNTNQTIVPCPENLPVVVFVNETDNGAVGNATNPRIIVRTYSITDAAGNQIFVDHTINVIDDTAPIITCQNVTVQLDINGETGFDPLNDGPALVAQSDNCGLDAGLSRTGPTTFTCAHLGDNLITILKSDVNDNQTTCDILLTVADDHFPCNEPPVAVCQDLVVSADDNCQGIAVASDFNNGSSDPNLDPLTFSISPPGPYPLGVTNVILTVDDGNGEPDTCPATITVNDDTPPVAPATPADLNLQCASDVPAPANLTATDNCDGAITASPTDVVTSGTCANDFTMVRTWTFSDACGNASIISQTITVQDDTPPVAPATPADLNLQCASDVPAATDLTATDNCDGAITASPTDVVTSGTCANDFTMVRTWTFSDACGNASIISQTITVQDDTPPVAPATPADLNLQCASDVPAATDLTATDNCDGAISASPITVITPGACANDFTTVRTWIFTDACGNTSSVSQTITVLDDTPPEIPVPPADLNLQCASGIPAATDLTATDNCDGAITASPITVITPGACANDFTTVRTWTFTDACGNTSSVSQTITVLDDTPPEIPVYPADLVLQCASDVPPAIDITTTDNCDGPITASPTIQVFPGTSVNDFVEVRTWTFTDQCSNSTSVSQVITVQDNTPPTVVCKNPTVTFNGESTLSIASSDVFDAVASFDNCTGPVTFNDMSQSDFSCSDVGSIIPVTVSGYDITGNLNFCTANVAISGLPCGFINVEDGIGCPDGSNATYDANTGAISVTSNGCSPNNVFQDEAAFVKYDLCGNGEIIVQVTNVTGNGWAGITMREPLSPGAKKVALFSNLSDFIRREVRFQNNAPANPQNTYRPNSPWLRIKRKGNKFTGYASTNGNNWVKIFNYSISMTSCIQMGLVVISNTPGETVTGTFNPILINGGSILPLSIPDNDHQVVENNQALPIQEFSLFPNPSKQMLYVDAASYSNEEIQVVIYNQFGQKFLQQKIEVAPVEPLPFDLSTLPAGIYWLSVISRAGQQSKQFLKAK